MTTTMVTQRSVLLMNGRATSAASVVSRLRAEAEASAPRAAAMVIEEPESGNTAQMIATLKKSKNRKHSQINQTEKLKLMISAARRTAQKTGRKMRRKMP